MFDIGWSELLIIGIVALIVIGPKELPAALRTLGQWMTKIRRMASEFQGQFQDAMREAELAELKKEMDDMAAKAQSYGQFDPLEDVRRDIEKSVGDLPPFDPVAESDPGQAAATPPPEPSATGTPTAASTLPADTPRAAALPADVAQPPASEPAPAAPASGAAMVDTKPDAGRTPA
jgi:sec-independent protein translocase protein TatB